MKFYLPLVASIFLFIQLPAQQSRWEIVNNNEIVWKTENSKLPHNDHIELSGIKSSVWLQYSVTENKKTIITRTIVFPTFRTNPFNRHATHASLMYTFYDESLPRILINKIPLSKTVINGMQYGDMAHSDLHFTLNGFFVEEKNLLKNENSTKPFVRLKHSIYPSAQHPMVVEQYTFYNQSSEPVSISMEGKDEKIKMTDVVNFNDSLHIFVQTLNDGTFTIMPNDSLTVGIVYFASNNHNTKLAINIKHEEKLRQERMNEIASKLQVETPSPILNTLFSFAKRRTTESLFDYKCGILHNPGGLSYYASIWANDQAEYVNPFFGYLGDDMGVRSVMTSFKLFFRFVNPEFKPIPSSIVSEGDGFWGGAGDRGDMAMISYGASRFALAYANADTAKKLLPLIDWCLEFCRHKLNKDGVVDSDTDELEGRFPAGTANLCTSSLYYDALISTSYLYQALHLDKAKAASYMEQAKVLRKNIEKYFGAKVEGFDTYRYYKENTVLRAWIAIPLVMDIFDRKEGTINALFSPRLWTEDGLATQAGEITFWDRATLYGFRGVFAAGGTEKAFPYFMSYSQRRLLGEHVPYPVEAYPEGNQRHLAAESALYCRIFTEGFFGIRPTGFRSFNCKPNMPAEWNQMQLKNINAFQSIFDLKIVRDKAQYKVSIIVNEKTIVEKVCKIGQTIQIML